MKSRANIVLFILIFLVPLLVITGYTLRVMSNRYHSDSIITITAQQGPQPTLNLTALGLPTVAGSQDALTLLAFINSMDMMQYLDKQLRIRDHYGDASVDWWTRLPATYSDEDFLKYLGGLVGQDGVMDTQLAHSRQLTGSDTLTDDFSMMELWFPPPDPEPKKRKKPPA